MEIEKEIGNKIEYEKYFLNKLKDKENIKYALNQALEIRKFEIELYWKRTTYFWAFIASSFAGYFVVLRFSFFKEMTVIVALIGLLFSIGWYLANRGSKYWQKNWEMHVDLLEEEHIGPLFSTILNPVNIKIKEITSEYPFSVSKINQILSFSIILIWIYILSYSLDYTFNILQDIVFERIINSTAFIVIFGWTIVLFVKKAETKLSKDIKKIVKKSEALLIARKKK